MDLLGHGQRISAVLESDGELIVTAPGPDSGGIVELGWVAGFALIVLAALRLGEPGAKPNPSCRLPSTCDSSR